MIDSSDTYKDFQKFNAPLGKDTKKTLTDKIINWSNYARSLDITLTAASNASHCFNEELEIVTEKLNASQLAVRVAHDNNIADNIKKNAKFVENINEIRETHKSAKFHTCLAWFMFGAILMFAANVLSNSL